jgi:hypothetical protein
MTVSSSTRQHPRATVRVILSPAMAEALERRARRNDRFPWLEAGRIIRETLVRDGELPVEDDVPS